MINTKWIAFIVAVIVLVTPAVAEPNDDLPLKPDRKIEFTTDEGTWLSLDVSPDGRTIIFDMLGDIYTMPMTGGTARLMFGGVAFESQPRYSRDGSMITFLSDRDGAENVWVANADGSQPRRLSSETQMIFTSPSFTSDGKQVMASRGTGKLPFELWLYDVDGSGKGKKVITGRFSGDGPAPANNAIGAVASPDGRFLYYAIRMGRLGAANSQFPLWQIARLDRRSGEEELLTQEQGSAFSPLLSPDGSRLIYGTRYETETGLRIKDLKTDDERWLKYPIQRDDQETFFEPSRDLIPRYAFVPDGSAILASYGGKINRIDIASGRSTVVPFKVNVSADVGPLLDYPERLDDGPVRARIIQSPSLSPDGKLLAFSALAHVHVMNVAEGKPRQLTNSPGGEFQPVWSPDGKWLAFITWTDQGGDIWKARSDGSGKPQRLTRLSAYYRDLAWSPDGTKLAVLKTSTRVQRNDQRNFPILELSPNQDLVWLSAEGGDLNYVMHANGMLHPQFTSEPDRIYYNVGQEMLSVRLDGSDRKKHVKVTGNGAGGRDLGPFGSMLISPDGRSVIVVFHALHSQAYLVPIPDGTTSTTVNVTAPKTTARMFASTGLDYLAWANGGKTVTWAAGASFFQQPVTAIQDQSGPDTIQRTDVVVERPRTKPVGTIVLRGARTITMRGDEVIADADIVISGNRIAGVGPHGAIAIPAGAKVIDVKGKTIVPGFIDMHDHWLDIGREVLDLRHWNFLMTLAYGVTTGRDPQIDSIDTFVYADLVETGDIPGPRAFASGAGIFWTNDLQSVDHAERVLRKYKDLYRIKFIKSYLVGNRRQHQFITMASKRLGLMPTVEGQGDTKYDLEHIIDGFSGNEHVMPTVPMYKDMVEFIARSKVFYTPTLVITGGGPYAENYYYSTSNVHDDPKVRRFMPHNLVDAKSKRRQWFAKDEYNFTRVAESLAKIVRAGGKVCVGSHGQIQGLAFHWEMWAMGTGMTPMEVLRSATLTGAEGLGYAADLGSIEKGKLADLVILDKNPLDDIRNTSSIKYVMKNGQLFEGDTLNEVWPDQKPLAPLWWWNDHP
jgi:Tol biopolymer transport system component